MAAFQNNNSTKPYVDFLKKQHTNPVDYVIGLYDKYDIVVLCERAHPEMTQWDFIYDIIRDPRFIHNVGHVFTEYGQVGMQDYLNKFMLTDSLSETEVHDHVIHIMRNMPVWPSWTNFNLYQYLTRLYYLNQKLRKTGYSIISLMQQWIGHLLKQIMIIKIIRKNAYGTEMR